MPFKATRNLRFGEKDYAAGDTVRFSEEQERTRDEFLALGAIDGEDDQVAAKPLEKMSKPQLQQIAAEEGVELPDGATNAQMVEAIKAKRAGI